MFMRFKGLFKSQKIFSTQSKYFICFSAIHTMNRAQIGQNLQKLNISNYVEYVLCRVSNLTIFYMIFCENSTRNPFCMSIFGVERCWSFYSCNFARMILCMCLRSFLVSHAVDRNEWFLDLPNCHGAKRLNVCH